MKNVLEYLEQSAKMYPDKIAVKDAACSYTYEQLQNKAKCIGACLAKQTTPRHPVCVFADKSADTLAVFFGIVYAGCFYTLVDPSFPEARIQSMLSVLQPDVIVDGSDASEKLTACGYTEHVVRMETLTQGMDSEYTGSDENQLQQIRESMIDTDPLYCNFTSGSTGTPKGVLVAHRSVLEFIDRFTEIFDITEADVIGNQAPFDFDVSVKDIYSAMKVGATLIVIPKAYFMFPNSVVDMLDENHVTTLIWAVSALCLLNRLHGLKHKVPADINKILFSGEAMPIRQLHAWQSYYPDAMFVNLYGPTEITCNCTYHILDRAYSEDEKLPIGIPFPNERVFLLDEENRLIEPGSIGKTGELCVAGTTRVMDVKRTAQPGFLILDGGIHQINYYGWMMGMKQPEIEVLAEKSGEEELFHLCGSLCTVNDVLARDVALHDPQKGDVICFKRCGAYAATEGMAMFLSRELPQVLICKTDGKIEKLRDQMETYLFHVSATT